MKTQPAIRCLFISRSEVAFTLVEMMISMGLMVMVLGGVIYSHVVGLKMYQITQAKLGSSDQARQSVGLLISDVRSSSRVAIGTGSSNSFVEVGDGTNQTGNAIQVYRSDYNATSNTNAYVRYYRDASTKQLIRKEGGSSVLDVTASSITNSTIFSAVGFTNNVLSNNDNNKVIAVDLEFYEIRYPIVQIGTNQMFEYYRVSTRITRRSL